VEKKKTTAIYIVTFSH